MNNDKKTSEPRILLIDDNESIHQDYLKILRPSHQDDAALSAAEAELFGGEAVEKNHHSYEIDSALQGEEGVAMVKSAVEDDHRYSMAFVDVRMPPGIDGVETTLKIWEVDPDVQIVICTAYSDYSWEDTVAKLGNSDRMVILKKPFDSAEVLQLAASMTNKWQLLQQSRMTLKDMESTIVERTHELELAFDKQKLQYSQIERLNQFQSLVSSINTLIVRVRDKQELFDDVCKIAVRKGGYQFARISLLESDHSLKPKAHYSTNQDAKGVSAIVQNADEATQKFDRKNQQATVCNDIKTEARIPPWCDVALQSGFESYAVMPLVIQDVVAGCIELYSDEKQAFDKEVVSLLHELTDNIAYAMEFILRKEQSEHIVSYDTLTGLANKALFTERAHQFLEAARLHKCRMAAVVIDIDDFKDINDTIGHSGADMLLQGYADILLQGLGSAKTVGRLSGDRFAAIVPIKTGNSDIKEAINTAVTPCLKQTVEIKGKGVSFTAKAGVALFPADGDNEDALISNAESALKTAKRSDSKLVFYTKKIGKEFSSKRQMEGQLYNALENNEFVLHYQPKVDLSTRKMCSAEALIRWNHPERGLVPPVEFIPMLEETGLIVEVGGWVLREAAQNHKKWTEAGLNAPRIAVNVSPVQLSRMDFVHKVRTEVLLTDDLKPGIDVEVTESMLMHDVEAGIEKLSALRDIGLTISIDDFGTGYSSLAYLSRLPIGAVKIDRSFVVEMTENADTMSIVSAIITLAHSMNLKVVAEGVDSEEQLKFLRLLKCDEIQGYLFSKPLPEDAFVALIKEDRDF